MTHRDDMHDDPTFEEYLKRDSALSRQYQHSSDEVVPPELDKKILAQARDAISDKNDKKVITHPSWWIKWNKPVALAATLMLAFTVIYKVGYQSVDRLSAPEAPQAVTQKANDQFTAPTVTQNSLDADKKSETTDALAAVSSLKDNAEQHHEPEVAAKPLMPSVQRALPPPPATSIAPNAATPVVMPAPAEARKEASNTAAGSLAKSTEQPKRESVSVVDSITAEDIGKFPDTNVAESLQRVPGVEIRRDAAPDKEKKTTEQKTDPDATLQRIRELRKHGKNKAADQAWKQFQKDFPYYEVAADDPARGNT